MARSARNSAARRPGSKRTTPSNLLLILSDQHSNWAMGASGNSLVQTPNLDAWSGRGARFTHAYCTSPLCVPSRASIATGRYIHQVGAWDNAAPYIGSVPSWGHRLSNQGIPVTTIGKLHFRNVDDDTGYPDQRLAMNVVHGIGELFSLIRPSAQPVRSALGQVLEAGPGESEYTRYDRAVTAEAVRWLKSEAPRQQEPWCLWVSFVAPHPPMIVPAEFFNLYPLEKVTLPIQYQPSQWPEHPWLEQIRSDHVQTRQEAMDQTTIRRAVAAYYGLCSFLDAQIGDVLDALAESGAAARTRVLYTSDHGEMLGDHGFWGKGTMYEHAINVPLILTGPDVPPETVVHENVSLIDLFPTVLEAVGVPSAPEDADLPGISLWPAARNGAMPQRNVFAEYHATGSPSAAFMLRNTRYKLLHYVNYQPQLFDLESDPEECYNLANDPAHAAVLHRMEAQLCQMVDPQNLERQAKADQQARLNAHGGEAIIRERGSTINYTPAPKLS